MCIIFARKGDSPMKQTCLGVIVFALASCGLDDGNLKKQNFGSSSMAITNAEGEQDVLRVGTALSVATLPELSLKANTVYRVVVSNLNTKSELAVAELLSDGAGAIPLSTVAHDIGEFDGVGDTHTLSVKVSDKAKAVAEMTIPVTPHEVHFEGHGFSINEIQPPHVYSADQNGTALNSFVVGGPPDPGEVAAPIYVAGKGFPTEVTKVDIYIVKDADVWQGKSIPKPGEAAYVLGPIVGTLDRGILRPTALGWQPTGADLGPYDILVDVDRNGKFDYSFSSTDGADGEGKVGFTVQYGQAFYRARSAMEGKHLLVNLAFDSASRTGSWANSYSKSSQIYSYVNPPVQSGARHAFVTKYVVWHQSWEKFWNNPVKYTQGGGGKERIYIGDIIVQQTGGTTQHSCTNSPPVAVINPENLPVDGTANPFKFDVVFDYDGDGYYDLGTDLLDVVGHRTDGGLISASELKGLTDDQIFGFQVTK
jgi:hypothetical protein